MEAMEKLKSGMRFSEVATQYSEDKARQGVRHCFVMVVDSRLISMSNKLHVQKKVIRMNYWMLHCKTLLKLPKVSFEPHINKRYPVVSR